MTTARMRCAAAVLAAATLAAPVALATLAKPPDRGAWMGVAASGEHRDPVSLRVVRRDGRLFVRRMKTTSHDTCAQPGSDKTTTVTSTVAIPPMRIRRDATFRNRYDGEIEVRGRFGAHNRVRGTISVAPEGLTCAGSIIRFRARPVPMVCCAKPSTKATRR